MDKERMLKLLDDRKMGERTRVLFEMLMESIGADYECTRGTVFEKIKNRLDAENDAIRMLSAIPKGNGKVVTPDGVVIDDEVSVSPSN